MGLNQYMASAGISNDIFMANGHQSKMFHTSIRKSKLPREQDKPADYENLPRNISRHTTEFLRQSEIAYEKTKKIRHYILFHRNRTTVLLFFILNRISFEQVFI